MPDLTRIVNLTIDMFDLARDAFVLRDAESVRNLAEIDDKVDELNEALSREIVAYIESGVLSAEIGSRYILVCRYLERIADHAVNIGERVVYMVTGGTTPTPAIQRTDKMKCQKRSLGQPASRQQRRPVVSQHTPPIRETIAFPRKSRRRCLQVIEALRTSCISLARMHHTFRRRDRRRRRGLHNPRTL